MAVLDKLLRVGEGKKVKALQGLVPDINALEPELQKLSDDAAPGEDDRVPAASSTTAQTSTDILVEAFAVVREAASRTIGQRHYDVQLMGGAALHFGWVAEMKTGEGKTLVSTLPVYLNGLTGKGVHVITVNDYLARRDSEWMGEVLGWLGLSIGLILPDGGDAALQARAVRVRHHLRHQQRVRLRLPARQHGHQRGQQGAARPQLRHRRRGRLDPRRRGPHPAHHLGPPRRRGQALLQVRQHRPGPHAATSTTTSTRRSASSPPPRRASSKVEAALGVENLYDAVPQNLVHQFQAALKAKELYKRDKDYIIQDGEVKIVDEFTGRILEGRRWSEGLHQAVEAKEGVKIKEENQTLATITLQNYFRMYDKLAGMTGTAVTEAAEFASTYDLQVVPIPTHRDMVRIDQPDLIYKTEDAKFDAVVDDIVERYETGQPVLVGTISVEKSEKLSRLLDKRGIAHEVLNAKQHTREAEIVTQAGRLHAVTVATNMAGRGVDILLGGNPEGLAQQGRARRGPRPRDRRGHRPLREAPGRATSEQTAAEGDKVRELGGLYVLGTERHESRRIDNQLRGRSGRQGDPGESRFYLSLEDELMRLFATGAMNWVMGKALPDDVPIEAKMVTKAIERAQNTVEQRNAEIRKNVLKYDEVMNEQRKVIYKRRDQILDEADLRDETLEYLAEAVDGAVSTFCVSDVDDEWDLEGLHAEIASFWPTELTQADMARSSRHRRAPRAAARRGHPVLREARDRARRRDHAPDRAPGDAQHHRLSTGASTCSRWTTSRRASTCGPWARRIRSSSGSARASRCSAR